MTLATYSTVVSRSLRAYSRWMTTGIGLLSDAEEQQPPPSQDAAEWGLLYFSQSGGEDPLPRPMGGHVPGRW